MDFSLSDEQNLLQETVRSMLAEHSGSRRVHEIINRPQGHDNELWTRLLEFGVAGMALPEEDGGLGLGMIDLALVAEELGFAGAPTPFFGHVLATMAVASSGTTEQRELWLNKLISGEVTGTVAFCETGETWLEDGWTLETGSGVSGSKRYVPGASAADLIVVGCRGGELGLVDRKRPGVSTTALRTVDQTRRMDDVTLAGATVEPLSAGSPEKTERLIDAGLVLLAADAFGGASRCVDMAVEYSKVRHQFGVPIASFQGLRYQLVQMAVDAEPCRGLYWYAAHAHDAIPTEVRRAAANAKAHNTDRFLQVARDNVEAHGGIGYTWDHDAHIFLKRAMFDWSVLGVPSTHRQRLANLSGW